MEKAASPSGQPDGAMGDIVATAVKAGQFNTLVAAVKAAGLVEALQADGPVTVFAPNDAAFAKLPDGAVAELLKPENRDRLTAVLTYHVVPGTIRIGETAPKTLQGSPLSIESRGVKVNGATVIASDIEASNGLIQIIDTVLMPPETRQTPPEAAEGVITLAISRGVPLFNAGQEAACAAIYEVALDSLLQVHTGALDDRQRTRIQQALQKVRQDGNHDAANAWTLRYALDDISRSLEGR